MTAGGRDLRDGRTVRAERLVPVALAAVVLLVAVVTITPWPVGAFQDDAIYTVLAKALATGEGYRMINLPGSPHATHYPPGYPVVLSILWRLAPSFPDNIVLFKFANAAWLALAALGTMAFARIRLGWSIGLAALAGAAGTLAIVVLLVTGVVLSEPLFMALLLPALLLSERTADTGRLPTALAAGLACGVLAMVRSLGAVTVPAAVLVLLWRRRFAAAAVVAAAAAAFLVPWQLWVSAWQSEIPMVLTGKYGAYGPWLAQGYRAGGLDFAHSVVVANLQSLDGFLSYAFMPVVTVWPRAIAFLTVVGLAVGGLVMLVRRAPVTALFLAAYLTVIMLWPFEPHRFVLAVWPLLTICAGASIMAIGRWRPGRRSWRLVRWSGLAVSTAVVAGFAVYNFRGYTDRWWASVQRDVGQRAKPIAEWVVQNTSESDVLITDDDLIVYLYTGRRGMPTSTFLASERLAPLPDEVHVAAVRTMIGRYHPRFFITTSSTGQRTAESLTHAVPPLLRRYRQISGALIYEVPLR
ncbi:MAG TPA: hypothetical protein VF981_04475 [Gemmatimonadaceae bacterium]